MKKLKIFLMGFVFAFISVSSILPQVYQLESYRSVQNDLDRQKMPYASFNGADNKISLVNYSGIQEIQLDVNLKSVSSVALGTLGTNLTVDITSGVVTLGSAFTNSTIYVNNIPTSSISAGDNFIVVQFDSVSISSGYLGYNGTSYGQFNLYSFIPFNTQTSTSELTDAYNNGEPQKAKVPFKYRWGSQTELIVNTTDRDFSGAVVDWTGERSGTISASGGLGILTPNTNTYSGARLINMNFVKGKKYRVTFKYRLQSGTAQELQVRDPFFGDANATLTFTPTSTQQTFTVETIVQSTVTYFTLVNGNVTPNGAVYEIDDVSIVEIGAVLEYKFDASNVGLMEIKDNSGNHLDGTLNGTYDGFWVNEPAQNVVSTRKYNLDLSTVGTTATKIFDIPRGYELTNLYAYNETAITGATTFSLGSLSTTTEIVSAGTISNGNGASTVFTVAKGYFDPHSNYSVYLKTDNASPTGNVTIIATLKRRLD